MTTPDDHHDHPLDRMLSDLRVDRAPVEAMVRAGRVRRHRRRAGVLGAVGAAVVVALVAAGTAIGGSDRPAAPADPTPPDADAVAVTARYTDSERSDPLGGTARWDPARRELTYTSRVVWSGSCPPAPSAAVDDGRISLTLADGPERACDADARTIAADLTGLTAAPRDLRVTERGQTLTVPVTSVGDTFDVVVETTRDPGEAGDGETPTGVRLTSFQNSRTLLDPQDPVRPPWRHRWRDLAAGGYTVSAATPPCTTDYGCDGGRTPAGGCYTRIALTSDTVVRVEVVEGRSCRIQVDTGGSERPVPLLASGWRPGQGGDAARAEGVLLRDRGDCVYLGDPATPDRRTLVSWPAGWTAAVDRDGGLLLRDDLGVVVARDGDRVTVGGGSDTRQGDVLGACDDRRPHEVFAVQSDVEVDPG